MENKMGRAEQLAIHKAGQRGDAIASLVRMVKLAVALVAACLVGPAHAGDRCHDKAAMYQLGKTLQATGLTDSQIVAQLAGYPFTELERRQAVERVKAGGDLGFMSAKTLYRHIYLECRGAA
jgi:hypothetical protein